jgi:hypothetical protein
VVSGFSEVVDSACEVPTPLEYADLLRRRYAGEILFYFDPVQCKDFLLRLDYNAFKELTSISLRGQCTVVRAIAYGLEPLALFLSLASPYFWLGWLGMIASPAVYGFWVLLKVTSSVGRQQVYWHFVLFAFGIALAILFRGYGLGFTLFTFGISTLYLAVKMLYALPVLFSSKLAFSCYAFARFACGHTSCPVTQGPMMWHKAT